MKDEIDISIILPCFNVAKYIDNCIQSILKQTFNNFEIIAINDGSTDDTLSILNNYNLSSNKLKIFNQENYGVSASRNLGLQFCRGKYVVFVDSDDYLELDYLEKLYQNITKNDNDLVCCAYFDHYKSKNQYLTSYLITGKIIPNIFISYLFKNIGGVLWDKIYKLDIINTFRIRFESNLNISEDLIFNLKYLQHINNIFIINDPLYHYNRENLIGLSRSISLKNFLDYKRLNYYIRVELSKFPISANSCEDILNSVILSQKISLVRNIFKLQITFRMKLFYLKFVDINFPTRSRAVNKVDLILIFLLEKKQYKICLYFIKFVSSEKGIFRHIFG